MLIYQLAVAGDFACVWDRNTLVNFFFFLYLNMLIVNRIDDSHFSPPVFMAGATWSKCQTIINKCN